MSHNSTSMNHHLFNEDMLYVGKTEGLNQTFGLPPNAMNDSPMKRSASGSTASFSDEQVPDSDHPRYAGTICRGDVKDIYNMSAGTSDWKSLPVMSEVEDVPSVSSPFGLGFTPEEDLHYGQVYSWLAPPYLTKNGALGPFDAKNITTDSSNGGALQSFMSSEYYPYDSNYFYQPMADEQQPKYYQSGNSNSWAAPAWSSPSFPFSDYLSMPSSSATQPINNYQPNNTPPNYSTNYSTNFDDFTRRGNLSVSFTGVDKAAHSATEDTTIQSPFSATSSGLSQDSQESPSNAVCTDATLERNRFLIRSKNEGLSYKEIKRRGGFREAESTLRGRYRTLTKAKEHRVRKPQWHVKDENLLIEAVAHFTDKSTAHAASSKGETPKVSWKKVAHYILANGGSYQFGNATCKKKWCELHGIKI